MKKPTMTINLLMDVRCGHCDRLLLQISSGADYVAKCGRCGRWRTPHGTFGKKPVDEIAPLQA
jgi:ribosomal protein S27E